MIRLANIHCLPIADSIREALCFSLELDHEEGANVIKALTAVPEAYTFAAVVGAWPQ